MFLACHVGAAQVIDAAQSGRQRFDLPGIVGSPVQGGARVAHGVHQLLQLHADAAVAVERELAAGKAPGDPTDQGLALSLRRSATTSG
ncbi:hypothetical protein HNP40_002935 [Mycobacteroides chelonae]|nr:hypothetical protein [Mycobacteroides chelonae]